MEAEITTQAVGLTSTDFSIFKLFLRADIIVKSVILILIAASIFSWAIIIEKHKLFFYRVPANHNTRVLVEKRMSTINGISHTFAMCSLAVSLKVMPLAENPDPFFFSPMRGTALPRPAGGRVGGLPPRHVRRHRQRSVRQAGRGSGAVRAAAGSRRRSTNCRPPSRTRRQRARRATHGTRTR